VKINYDNWLVAHHPSIVARWKVDVSPWKFLDELRNRNIVLKYSMADAQLEIEKILGRRNHIVENNPVR